MRKLSILFSTSTGSVAKHRWYLVSSVGSVPCCRKRKDSNIDFQRAGLARLNSGPWVLLWCTWVSLCTWCSVLAILFWICRGCVWEVELKSRLFHQCKGADTIRIPKYTEMLDLVKIYCNFI